MKIALFGHAFGQSFNDNILSLISTLEEKKVQVFMYRPLFDFMAKKLGVPVQSVHVFNQVDELPATLDFIFSIGGDGTFLEAVRFSDQGRIPILGINSGRLGFLADISKQTIGPAVEMVLHGKFSIENRALLQFDTEQNPFTNNYALNEVTIHKNDSSSMIKVHTFINDEFLNTFWADGLIISTPTGSTAYSLSVGGPIMLPQSASFSISPIAPHNLTVRPIVVPDNVKISMEVEGRTTSFLATLDYESRVLPSSTRMEVQKAGFFVKILKLENHSFFGTLRNKLMWGLDRRN